ncbi:MAG: phenylacetate--CoA ligase family protein [Anaerolineales bacterium]|nr:phenylacetate--CoA ligase family protein [Anaerolineales bacterium]
MRKHETWTRAQLEASQADALRQLREYAYAHSPFYQKFHQGLTDRPLNELPVLTKAMLMENFDELVTDPSIRLEKVREFSSGNVDKQRYLDSYLVTATSGSSGHPGFFLFNESEWITVIASFARGQEWSGAKVNLLRRRRMATVASISPWHMSSQVAVTVKTPSTPSIRIAASSPLENIVKQLNAWQPNLLIAYASMSRILAEEQLAGRLHIAPEKVFTSSEVLTDETRRRVKAAWGDEPFNQYGATETADIAAEYKLCRRMHVFEDLLLVEVVDQQYRPVPRGEFGTKLLVTTLFSRTQPLIRYEMNDSVRLSAEPCSICGLPFTFIDGVQGRMEDALSMPGIKGGQLLIQPLVFNRVMDILPVSGWQVVQETDSSLTVLLSGARNGIRDEAVSDAIRKELTLEGAIIPLIKVQHVTEIPKSASGKAPLIKSNVPQDRKIV